MSPAPAGRLHRAVGIETEYGVTSAHVAAGLDGAPLSVEEAVQEVFRDVSSPPSGTHRFTTSGARLYIDIGMHPEYAGPECVWVTDAVAQDLAGDAVLASMTRAANARLESRGVRIHLLKSNTDAWGSTFGCHENYQVTRDAPLPLGGMVGLLAARQILAGTGSLACGRGGQADAGSRTDDGGTGAPDTPDPPLDHPLGPMLYSARADHIHGAASADPTHERAFVNTRDEPHADASRLRRLHVTCADTTMAEPTTGLRAAVTLLLLDALEVGWDFSDLTLADPLVTLSALGESPWGDVPATTVQGRCLSAVDIQEAFLERLTSYLDDAGVPDFLRGAEHLLADLAPRVISAQRHHDDSAIDTEIDWAIKRRLMRAQRERHPQLSGQSLETLRSRVDLAYHDLNAETGLVPRLVAQGAMVNLCDPEEIERARQTPPATRAALRGAFVAACLEAGADFSVSWESLRLDSPPTAPVDLPDPLETSHEAAESLTQRVLDLRPEEMHRIDLVGRGGLGAPG